METLEPAVVEKLGGFKRRMDWFLANRPDLTGNVASMDQPGVGQRSADVDGRTRTRLRRVGLKVMLDENEFLSPHGIRALSRYHKEHPYVMRVNGSEYAVNYEPAESTTGLFGGNSNWRGPIWFPANFLMVESLQKFHHYLGNDFRVEFPTGSGKELTLWEVSAELSRRMTRLFLKGRGWPAAGERGSAHL